MNQSEEIDDQQKIKLDLQVNTYVPKPLQSWKEKEAEQKALKNFQKQQRREQLVKTMSPEELAQYDAVHVEFKTKMIEENQNKRKNAREKIKVAHKIIIDCSYYELMRPSELKSLRQQIMYCYGLSMKSPNPLRIQLLNYSEEYLQLSKIDGFTSWEVDHITSYPENAVYLTADSTTMMETYSTESILVIGGLVDRNRYKNITLKKAVEHNMKTICIPIKQHVKLQSSQVITVNQIFELVQFMNEGSTVAEACIKAIPERKVKSANDSKENVQQEENVE
ncbi:tRNA_(guanine9-N1)-methyltransferase [Hexamita inflata]|uniref:tRNA (guanine(9)-N(1))-methyltransferase n=1 Tax=Hexamita inflata TaxID=28002 RepID=A0AA86NYB6_9EUKA|nr:tRNA (guanine9-N1)-methyltransferase [Hexamita inflata]CAI9927573.1 tRNA (guanine9-N1)-methyltransferase [Hexamita inflata]CAI9950132.1 tRNA (guanine9-N1)-methyltransferase [Hexamita inflata]